MDLFVDRSEFPRRAGMSLWCLDDLLTRLHSTCQKWWSLKRFNKLFVAPDTPVFWCPWNLTSGPVADDKASACEASPLLPFVIFRSHHWRRSVLIMPWQLSCSTNAQCERGHKYNVFRQHWCLSSLLHEFAFPQTNSAHNGSLHSADRLGVLSVCIQCLFLQVDRQGKRIWTFWWGRQIDSNTCLL